MSFRKIFIPLFWKFVIAIVLVVALFGSANLLFLTYSVNDLFEKELSGYGVVIAKTIADRSVDPMLYNDLATLNKLVSEVKKNDKNIAYTFILDANKNVLAHTFTREVPASLINLKKKKTIQTINLEYKKGKSALIRDISVPIIDNNVGTVRMGFYEANYRKTLNIAKSFFLKLVALFLIVGIFSAFIFSYIITKPINILSSTAKKLNLNQFNKETLNTNKKELILSWQNPFGIHDEIDDLFKTFNNMIRRLEKAYINLQGAQESLMQSEKIAAIGTLSMGIAHEINNPIAGIQNCLKRISENPKNIEQNLTYIELMDEAINKIKNVVQGLLNFSRKHDLIFTIIDIKKIINNILILIAYQLEKSNITIVKDYPENIPNIKGSFNHLEQVFLNLIINAIDAINENKLKDENFKGELDIYIFTTEQFLEIKIKDNGIGIPNDKIKQIFNPFYTLKKIKQGTGLGLAVSLNIIQQHHGKIEAINNKDGGVTFTIYLPLNN